jgi:hypothetical protein
MQAETEPLENALRAVEAKNLELTQTISNYQRENATPTNVGPLSSILKGLIDAAVCLRRSAFNAYVCNASR